MAIRENELGPESHHGGSWAKSSGLSASPAVEFKTLKTLKMLLAMHWRWKSATRQVTGDLGLLCPGTTLALPWQHKPTNSGSSFVESKTATFSWLSDRVIALTWHQCHYQAKQILGSPLLTHHRPPQPQGLPAARHPLHIHTDAFILARIRVTGVSEVLRPVVVFHGARAHILHWPLLSARLPLVQAAG